LDPRGDPSITVRDSEVTNVTAAPAIAPRKIRHLLVDIEPATTSPITTYRRHNKPALGPVGDSLDDLDPPFGGNAA
jgi:hypothetical protein